MAKDKDRAINPAAAQRKADKNKALKKSRAELQARRNEKLAKRNPNSIQRKIDDLKALESSASITQTEKAILADLERDLKAVNKARETLGDKAPTYTNRRDNTNNAVLGKRGHDGQRKLPHHRREQSGSDTDDSVRAIPWPRDTPPPIPHEFRRNRHQQQGNSNTAQLGERSYPAPAAPKEAVTSYSAAPDLRDFVKESTSRFVPTVVKRKQDAVKGQGGLLEPEELDRLEREGYIKPQRQDEGEEKRKQEPPVIGTEELMRLKEEEERFQREIAMVEAGVDQVETAATGITQHEQEEQGAAASRLQPSRHVEMEEVEDEDL